MSPTSATAPHLTSTYEPIDGFDAWTPLAETMYQRLADEFAAVSVDRWNADTPCTGWTVRDLAGHLVGAMRAAASLRETMSQQRAVKRRAASTGEQEVDAMTAIQIERAGDLSVDQVVAELQALVGPATRGRRRLPGVVRRRAGFQVEMGSISERWALDYFLSTILTRDTWLHRVDLADALGYTLALDDQDRAIVGDVAAEWCRRHGRDVSLTLTGDAGGTLAVGADGPAIELDALEFCRIVSGRSSPTHPLLEVAVPF